MARRPPQSSLFYSTFSLAQQHQSDNVYNATSRIYSNFINFNSEHSDCSTKCFDWCVISYNFYLTANESFVGAPQAFSLSRFSWPFFNIVFVKVVTALQNAGRCRVTAVILVQWAMCEMRAASCCVERTTFSVSEGVQWEIEGRCGYCTRVLYQ